MSMIFLHRARCAVVVLTALAISSYCVKRGVAAADLEEIQLHSSAPAATSIPFGTSASSYGDVSPGNSPGIMTFGGDVTFGAGSTLQIELAGTAPGTGYDQVKVAGQLTLAGRLQVLLTGLTPAAGQSFDILDWGSLVGTFSSLNLPALGNVFWNSSQLYTNGIISISSSAGVAGDYNNNGVVDAADYVVWRNNVGTTNTLPNDPTGGTIGATQYNTWRSHFGQTFGSGTVLTRVPEPTGALLHIVATALLFAPPRLQTRHSTGLAKAAAQE